MEEGLRIFLSMCRELAGAVKRDLDNGIIAVWHDESHLNKYVVGRHPLVLGPEYLFPETLVFNRYYLMGLKHRVKILVKDKSLSKYGGHAWLRKLV